MYLGAILQRRVLVASQGAVGEPLHREPLPPMLVGSWRLQLIYPNRRLPEISDGCVLGIWRGKKWVCGQTPLLRPAAVKINDASHTTLELSPGASVVHRLISVRTYVPWGHSVWYSMDRQTSHLYTETKTVGLMYNKSAMMVKLPQGRRRTSNST